MTAGVAITRHALSAAALRGAAARSSEAGAAGRMLALALVLEGHPRSEAAVLCGMDRQTLRDRVHRYNEAGLPGLFEQGSARAPAQADPDAGGRSCRVGAEVPSLLSTAWCVGAGWTWPSRSTGSSASGWPPARWASC
jgi:hypothetical protein